MKTVSFLKNQSVKQTEMKKWRKEKKEGIKGRMNKLTYFPKNHNKEKINEGGIKERNQNSFLAYDK